MTNSTTTDRAQAGTDAFDASAKEEQLREESSSWDTSTPVDAEPGDIPAVSYTHLTLPTKA